uniref:Uncharacterized protein n=1 Tax=Arundo donax TaxID=35708 RepID=A0A0A9GKW1_ARUDO
MISTTAKTTP